MKQVVSQDQIARAAVLRYCLVSVWLVVALALVVGALLGFGFVLAVLVAASGGYSGFNLYRASRKVNELHAPDALDKAFRDLMRVVKASK